MKVVFDYADDQYALSWDASMSCIPRIGDDVLIDDEDESKVRDFIVGSVIWMFGDSEPYAHVSLHDRRAGQ